MADRRVALVGASGVLGRALAPKLADAGFAVRAISRHPGAGAARIEPCAGDILDPDTMRAAVDGCRIVIHAATAVPAPGAAADWSLNDRIRREGTANLLAAAAAAGADCYVQQSIAMLLSADDSRRQTEDDPTVGNGALASALDMEALVQASPLDWRIVRGGLFYGPGTGREGALAAAARTPGWRAPGDGSGWLSPIHVEDMASAVITVIRRGRPRSVYNAVDDAPLTWRALCDRVAARCNRPSPPDGGPMPLPSFRVSNERLRQTGWKPQCGDLVNSFERSEPAR